MMVIMIGDAIAECPAAAAAGGGVIELYNTCTAEWRAVAV